LKGVANLHDNAYRHTSTLTIKRFHQLIFEVLKYPLYGPDLAPSDCHLFGPLTDTLRGHHFTSDQEVKEAVYARLVIQPKICFSDSIQQLVDCWTKRVEKDVDYEENDAVVHMDFNYII
jgi:hypothetical protein